MTPPLKKAKKTNNISGFAKYALLEQTIKMESEWELNTSSLPKEISGIRPRKLDLREPIFVESVGDVSLYSVVELSDLYVNARRTYGDDKERLAKEILEDLGHKQNRRHLAGSPDPALIHQLREDFPNFAEAVDYIEYAAALSQLSNKAWFQMSPLLLLGPPGVGKTAFAQAFAKILGVYFRRIDIANASTGSIIAGLSFGWSTGHTGEVFRAVNEANTANPLLMLDEVDKITGSTSYPIEPVLLSLLEKESAETFKEEAVKLNLNCKYFLWIATANDLKTMSEPLKSRFTIVHVRPPNATEIQPIIRNIYQKIRASNPWGAQFSNHMNEDVIKALIEFSPRELSRILQTAFGKAAMRGSHELQVSDIVLPEKIREKQFGFT